MNGSIKDAVYRTATIDNIEEDMFIAFYKFAYRSKYNTPSYEKKDNSNYFSTESK